MTWIGADQFADVLLRHTPILDVRAPVEFFDGHLPSSTNSPILDNDQRALVGTAYKQKGQQEAIRLGHELISGAVKEKRILEWSQFFQTHPDGILTCFRGGLRSQISQSWLKEAGIDRPRIQGGYKAMRGFLLSQFTEFQQRGLLTVVSGATGAGKTLLLRDLSGRRVCDLEKYAHHRGSAFGGYGDEQPRQIQFENSCALDFLRWLQQPQVAPLLIEDESRLIGRCVQPDPLFEKLRSSPVIVIEESLESRVDVTFNDYILGSELNETLFARYKHSLFKISKKLGGLRHQEIDRDLDQAIMEWRAGRGLDAHRVWIEKLLQLYYDPMYFGSLEKRNPRVLFRGSRKECQDFLMQVRDRA